MTTLTNLETEVLNKIKEQLTPWSDDNIINEDNQTGIIYMSGFDMNAQAVGGVLTSLQNKNIIHVEIDEIKETWVTIYELG